MRHMFSGIWLQKQMHCGYWRQIMRLFKDSVEETGSEVKWVLERGFELGTLIAQCCFMLADCPTGYRCRHSFTFNV
ncbi:hypothetical protein Q8A67_013731 [Cirrhinus molitorella]|uniref:Uncharacterized protein n=1 Tax=Cirrhinus molitorella TaxID=172907 RepID=A0AA88TVH3_9TELE|nr:hypothetical protein Q8A67_013731 [Cirrhinus molitorella]